MSKSGRILADKTNLKSYRTKVNPVSGKVYNHSLNSDGEVIGYQSHTICSESLLAKGKDSKLRKAAYQSAKNRSTNVSFGLSTKLSHKDRVKYHTSKSL